MFGCGGCSRSWWCCFSLRSLYILWRRGGSSMSITAMPGFTFAGPVLHLAVQPSNRAHDGGVAVVVRDLVERYPACVMRIRASYKRGITGSEEEADIEVLMVGFPP